jgi:hypothetical protein
MSDPHSSRDGLPDIARRPINSDGKGSSGFLLDWHRSEPRGVVVKPGRQVLAEFFTSMLVLSASFKYKPTPGVANYLYLVDGRWSLSLIAPDEWSETRRAGFVGTCILQRDMTWTIEPSDRLQDDDAFVHEIGRFFDAFVQVLDTDLTLEEILPFCAGGMPYYQRLYASALSRSLRAAVTMGGQRGQSGRAWRAALPEGSGATLIGLGGNPDD